MATVQNLLARKSTQQLLATNPEATVCDAVQLMNNHKIGSLLVLSEGQLVGIITERDLLQRVLAPCRDPNTTLVREVMTTELLCCRPETPLEDIREIMKTRRVRHLPVIDEQGALNGLVSIGDVNAYQTHDQEVTIHILKEYIHGRV
jgi:CBS domain-containing protein